MTKIEFRDGTQLVVDSEKLRNFFIENGIAFKDYLEYIIRKKLGQNLKSYIDYVKFKEGDKPVKENRPDHLRFNMTGQRDSDGGLEENQQILKIFNLPITLRSSHDYKEYNSGDFDNIFIFHKGSPTLFKRKKTGELEEIQEFSGFGTVEILIELIKRFALEDFIEDELKVV